MKGNSAMLWKKDVASHVCRVACAVALRDWVGYDFFSKCCKFPLKIAINLWLKLFEKTQKWCVSFSGFHLTIGPTIICILLDISNYNVVQFSLCSLFIRESVLSFSSSM